jgi:hypothetical protein
MNYLLAPICAFHMYAVDYDVYYQPPFNYCLRNIACKRKLINFN